MINIKSKKFKITFIAVIIFINAFSGIYIYQSRKTYYPKTLEEAVEFTINSLSEENRNIIINTPRNKLITYHLTWGMNIRNSCGLWEEDSELLKDICGEHCHPDSASYTIMYRAWKKLKKQNKRYNM